MLRRWNRFFFKQSLSIFDILGIGIITSLASMSYWYFLLFIPLIISSVHFQLLFASDDK